MKNKNEFKLLLKLIEDCFDCKVCNKLGHVCYFCYEYLIDLVPVHSGESLGRDYYKSQYMRFCNKRVSSMVQY